MKKLMIVVLLLCVLLGFQNVFALSGACGKRVGYSIEGNTITFSGSSDDAEWGNDCKSPLDKYTDITIINFSNSIHMKNSGNFSGLKNVKEIQLTNLDISAKTDMSSMFEGCSSLESLDVSSWDTSNVTNMSSMFKDCSSLESLDVSAWDTSNVADMSLMFYDCYALNSLDVSHFDTSHVTDMRYMFADCYNLPTLDVSHFITSNVTNMSWMFWMCKTLTTLDVSHFDTSNVTKMSWMFADLPKLTTLDLSNFNTSNVTSINSMFKHDTKLSILDVSGWDTSNVTNMDETFRNCSSLTNLDLSHWDTSKVTTMRFTFNMCSRLENLDISSWDTSNVTDMEGMFLSCYSLNNLDVSGWNTSKVTDMGIMFHACSSLSFLDLSNFDTSKETRTAMLGMFTGGTPLLSIALGEKTLVTDIFTAFDNRSSTWYYVAVGEAATNPLKLNTALDGETLFASYDYRTMAGVWSTDPDYVPEARLSLRLFRAVENERPEAPITVLEYNDGNLLPLPDYSSDHWAEEVSDEFFLEINALYSPGTLYEETITLPAGLSFSYKEYKKSLTITIRGGNPARYIPVYSVYDKQNNANLKSVIITANGTFDEEIKIWVRQGEGIIRVNPEKAVSDHKGPYKENIIPNWDVIINEQFSQNEAILALDLAMAPAHAKKNLHNLGFSKIEFHDSKFLMTSDPFSCAHFFAQKKIPVNNQIKTIVVVIIRGTTGTGEWIGDALAVLGDESPSTFESSAMIVFNNLQQYLEKNLINAKDTIAFLCGHSRGAAAAGIVGHMINSSSNRYRSVVYAFATPNNVYDNSGDKNIYNYTFAHDVISYLPQKYVKFGTSKVVGSSEIPREVAEIYSRYTLREYPYPDNSILIDLIANYMGRIQIVIGKNYMNGESSIGKKDLSPEELYQLMLTIYENTKYSVWTAHCYENYRAWIEGNWISQAKVYKDHENPTIGGSNEKVKLVLQEYEDFLNNRPIIGPLQKTLNSMVRFGEAVGYTVYSFNHELIDKPLVSLYKIRCPVDVKLYAPDGTVVASIINHQVEFVNDDGNYYADTDGENDYLFYPVGSGYYPEITGNDDGEMEIEILGIGERAEIVDSVSFTNVSVRNYEKFRVNLVEDDLDQSTLTSLGIGEQDDETKVFITDMDDLSRSIDLGTTGESWEKLTYQLNAVVRPSGNEQNVSWTSSDLTIATVDSTGLVTALKPGVVDIIATAEDGSNSSASVSLNIVTNIQSGNLSVKELVPVGIGCNIQLETEIDQAVKPVNQNLVWSSEDPEIASVDSTGKVTGITEGTAVIKVCPAETGQYCSYYAVEVLDATEHVFVLSEEAIDLSEQTITVPESVLQLRAHSKPYTSSYVLDWTSSDPDVAEVDETGYVTFKKGGTVTIHVTATDGSGQSSWVKLVYEPPLADSVDILDPDEESIAGKTIPVEDGTYQLTASAEPKEALQKFNWTSSDPDTAEVDENGKVTFKKTGTVTITAEATDGSGKSAQVELVYEPTLADSVDILGPDGTSIAGKTKRVEDDTYQLNAAADPENASQKFKWTSSDPEIAEVDENGKVTFKKDGKVTITAEATDGSGKSAQVELVHGPLLADSVDILGPDGDSIAGKSVQVEDDTYQLNAAADPEDALQKFNWTSSDPDTAEVDDNGKVTFKKDGPVTITAAAVDGSGKSAQVELVHETPLADSVDILGPDGTSIAGKSIRVEDDTYQLNASAEPENASQKFKWTSSDPEIAEVDENGKVTFKKDGPVTITAEATDGSGKSAQVELVHEPPLADSVDILGPDGDSIAGKTIRIVDDETYQLSASAEPENASQKFTWTSSDPDTAEVDENGKVTFKKDGPVTITAEATDGSGKSAQVNLVHGPLLADSVEIHNQAGGNLTGKSITVKADTYQLNAAAKPADASQTFTWTSSNPDVAEVDENGKVTFLTDGTVTISVTTTDGSDITVSVVLTKKAASDNSENPSGFDFFRINELPKTGFSSRQYSPLAGQPKDLVYSASGLTLQIPSIDVDSPIVIIPFSGGEYPIEWLGTDVGMLEGSSKPGDGITIITGHNHLNTTESGPFAFLSNLENGSRIFVNSAHAQYRAFAVYANEKIPAADIAGLQRIATKYDNALTLVTCEDELPDGGYASRRVVAARPIVMP